MWKEPAIILPTFPKGAKKLSGISSGKCQGFQKLTDLLPGDAAVLFTRSDTPE
jgi:hypothetical protein